MTRKNKAQVTIFIILALIIIVAIAMLFLLMKPKDFQVEDIENPQAYIDSCTREFTEEAIEILLKNGGDIEPKNSILYLDENFTYLCYTNKNLETCVAEEPALIRHMEEEITDYITPKVENCFNRLKAELEDKNYDIELENMKIIIQLQLGQVVVNIDRDFKMTKRDETRSFDNFRSVIVSPIYDLAEIAIRIVDNKANSCEFDYINHMLLYSQYDILFEKTHGEDDIEIYTIKDLDTQKQFKFAVRGCVIPPGLKV